MARQPVKKNDILSQWARQTPTTKVGVMFFVAVLLGVVYWQFFLKDLRAEKTSEESSRTSLLGTQAGLNKRIDALEKLKQERDALEAEVAGLEFALPEDAELNSFLDHLQTKAGDAGVSFKVWTNEEEKPVGKYQKVPLTVTVEGNFYQLMNYMYLLGPQDKKSGAANVIDKGKFDRIVTIENINISEASLRNDEILLTATFTAATFRQDAPEPPKEDPKKAAAGKKTAPTKPAAPAATPKKREPFKGAGPAGKTGNTIIQKKDAAIKKRNDDAKRDLKKIESGAKK